MDVDGGARPVGVDRQRADQVDGGDAVTVRGVYTVQPDHLSVVQRQRNEGGAAAGQRLGEPVCGPGVHSGERDGLQGERLRGAAILG